MEKKRMFLARQMGETAMHYSVLVIEGDIVYYHRYCSRFELVILEWAGRLQRANNRGYTVTTYSLTGTEVSLFFSRGLWAEISEDWFEGWRRTNFKPAG